jgi:hypothetical protein
MTTVSVEVAVGIDVTVGHDVVMIEGIDGQRASS